MRSHGDDHGYGPGRRGSRQEDFGGGRAAFGPFGPPFGGGPFGGGRGGRGGGRGRARRGDVRASILALLKDRPMHGYEMIQEIGERSGGAWKPSPGSVYPTLQLLEDEGLITSASEGARSSSPSPTWGAARPSPAPRPPGRKRDAASTGRA